MAVITPFCTMFKLDSMAQVKAKAMRKPVDKMITLAKDGTLHARRQVRLSACDCIQHLDSGV